MAVDISGNSLYWKARVDNTQLAADTTKTKGIFSGLKSSITSLNVFAGVAISAGIVFKKIIQYNKEYETSLASLQAITGSTADEMSFFRQEAIDLSKNLGIVDGQIVKSTKSSIDIATAFQLVGSAKAELLGTPELLSDVTQQVLILAEASGMDLTGATDALTKSMNQFGVSANDASIFVDILATSQQKGTATISDLTLSMQNCGATANSMGLTFEETNAILQGFAKGGTTGSEAGTQLSGVLSKLATSDIPEFNTSSTNAIEVIDNLAKANLSYTDLIELTDDRGAKWLSTLIAQNDTIQALNGNLNESGNALGQAKIQTDTLQGSLDVFKNTLQNIALGLDSEDGLTGSLKAVVDFGNLLLENIELFTDNYKVLFELLGDLFGAFTGLAEAFGIVSEEGEGTNAIFEILAVTTKIAFLPMKSAIWIITKVIEGITWLVEKIKEWIKGNETATKVINALSDAFEWLETQITNVIGGVKALFGIAADAQKLKELSDPLAELPTRIEAINEALEEENEILSTNTSDMTDQLLDLMELERLRVEAMEDSIEKRLALIDLEFKESEEKYKDNAEALLNIETIKNRAIEEATQEYYEEIAQQTLEFQQAQIDIMKEGLDKELAELQLNYQQRIDAAKELGLDIEQLETELQEKILEKQQEFLNAQNELQLTELDQLHTFELIKFQLIEDNENKIKLFEEQQALERLERQLQLGENLTDIERQTLEAQIEAQKVLIAETELTTRKLYSLWDSVGTEIANSNASSAQSFQEFASSVANAARSAISAWIAQAVTKIVADQIATIPFPASLIAAPIAGAAAKALFEKIVPQFATGGVIPSGYGKDNYYAGLSSNEVVLNPKQQANLLFKMANQSQGQNISFSKLENLMIAQNKLIKDQKNGILKGDRILIIRDGMLTGEQIIL